MSSHIQPCTRRYVNRRILQCSQNTFSQSVINIFSTSIMSETSPNTLFQFALFTLQLICTIFLKIYKIHMYFTNWKFTVVKESLHSFTWQPNILQSGLKHIFLQIFVIFFTGIIEEPQELSRLNQGLLI